MISKVSAPNSVPTDISDYVAQNAHMMAFMNQVNMQAFVLTNPTTSDKPKIGLGSYISHGGSLYKVETADEDIVGSPADGKVYVRVTGDATLSASFVTDISSYNYNHAYGTLTSGSYTLLPYEIRKSGSSWLKYRYDAVQRLQAESLNTGQGDFKIGQNLRPTDNVEFATVDTGHGANELYPMNQAVRTTDNVSFNQVTTLLGPNKPVDNNDASMPSVGIGGFSYAEGISETVGAYPSITIGSGGTWVYIAVTNTSDSSTYYAVEVGRVSGGSTVKGLIREGSDFYTYVSVIAWRIA